MLSSRQTFAEIELGLSPGSFPFESRFLDIHGARLHYIDEGQGQCLFMLHGNPTWSFVYRKLVLALRGDFRCVAMDLAGFGLSTPASGFGYRPEDHVPLVCEVLERLNIKGAVLVAHDWGAAIGCAAAFSTSHRLVRFVFGNTAVWPVNGDWYYEAFAAVMGGPVGRWAAKRFNVFVNGVIPIALRRGRLPPSVMEAYRAPFLRSGDVTGTYVFPASITRSREFLAESEAKLGRLNGDEVLLIWADGDIAFRNSELKRWRRMLPQASVVSIERCGHFLWEEAAAEANEAIRAWLQAKRPLESSTAL